MKMDRRERLLRGCPVASGLGLEFGALANPVIRKEEGRIVYVDYTDTGTLRQIAARSPNLIESAVVEVDIDLRRGSLVDLCLPLGPFDYAVASHVFEHLPNPVGWLRDVSALLVPNGVIALAVPDRRYTFDFFRSETTAAQLVGYDLQKWTKPSPVQLCDHFFHVRKVDTPAAWITPPTIDTTPRHHDDESVARILGRAMAGKHVDCHCTVWTSDHFRRVIPEAIRLCRLNLRLLQVHDPVPGTNEFIVQFVRI
jgi:SAM-dependent methyltransferase